MYLWIQELSRLCYPSSGHHHDWFGLRVNPQKICNVCEQTSQSSIGCFILSVVTSCWDCLLICKVLNLPPLLAVGLMLLAASPGGSTANLFSYLFKGDIALNITLTAINSVIAAFTLPLIVNFAIQYFMQDGQHVSMQFSKILQVFSIILIPVCIGMLIRHYAPSLP